MPGLFDPNDGGGLFDEPASKPEKTSGDLFGENSQNSETENSGLFGGEPTERKESTSGKKLPAGAVAMPGKGIFGGENFKKKIGMGGLFAQKDEVKETKTTSRVPPKCIILNFFLIFLYSQNHLFCLEKKKVLYLILLQLLRLPINLR